ncbi:glycoside hydrolase family 16 protein [Zopfia rhizophila CBS 207.26]|uniref:Glycoside hydrolase family 16 protein n=1 Tax=Zopfia rhizophila CBS 207.26 TaxID=1314779 RepID=A0A6A6E3I2_9PEZI|nr:glycoside hydrolase family 16 protein [Zopfia rhizophila CBS 207.26]
MSFKLDKLLEKGKAKFKEYSGSSSSSHPGQGYPNQQQSYPGVPYPPQPPPNQYPPYNGPPPNQYPPYNSPPPNQYEQYGPPPGQWGPPPPGQFMPPPPNQFGPPPPQQPFSPPPVPQHSKPQSPSPNPPPIPGGRPSPQPPPSSKPPPSNTSNAYWQPSFSPSVPVTQNFRHELGAHGWGNNEAQNYVADAANSFHTPDGRLVVRSISHNGTYTSARLTSHQTLSRARGYLTVTVLAPCAEGIWPAFWLLPKDPFQWPNDGEVDIFESWNGDCVNHSCLHWGHFNGEDWNKHRVVETSIPTMPHQQHTFGFTWIEEDGIPEWRGRMIWYIDGRPVMKGNIPLGTRRMEEFRVLINVAMGGNVCQGNLPRDGAYDFVVSDLKMIDEPVGGWGAFERDWGATLEGKAM